MATNYTPNLHLPQWVASDKPNFLAEINGAWAAIDMGYGQNKTDAATAITAANGAATDAENAVSKVNAIAAQMVTLQQTLAQLEADFVNSHYIDTPPITVTNAPENLTISASCALNEYVCEIHVYGTLNSGASLNGSGNLVLGTVTGIPGTFKKLTTYANFSSNYDAVQLNDKPTTCLYAVNIVPNGTLTLECNSYAITGPALIINTTFVLPVFRTSSARVTPAADIENVIFINKL